MNEARNPMDARKQWQRDTAGELPRWEEEWQRLPQGINQERWCGWISQELEAAAGGGETAYQHLLQLHCAGRIWAARTLQPLLHDSPHRLRSGFTLDLEEDIIEEMIQPDSLSFPASPLGERKPNRYAARTVPRDWLEWARTLQGFLNERAEVCDEARRMVEEDPSIPAYTADQVVQNIYDLTVSLCVAAQQWGELLLRTGEAGPRD